ncbi:MAG: hypothetical protein QW101_01225 [Ignisphaera sp.]
METSISKISETNINKVSKISIRHCYGETLCDHHAVAFDNEYERIYEPISIYEHGCYDHTKDGILVLKTKQFYRRSLYTSTNEH